MARGREHQNKQPSSRAGTGAVGILTQPQGRLGAWYPDPDLEWRKSAEIRPPKKARLGLVPFQFEIPGGQHPLVDKRCENTA
jgi:hypothetical protein